MNFRFLVVETTVTIPTHPPIQSLAAIVTLVMINGMAEMIPRDVQLAAAASLISQGRQPVQYVAYYRVSTDRQGESGLGLEAQRQAVAQFIGGVKPMAEFEEVESGKNHRNRPQLLAAIELCRRKRARLVIAKLDRLARNVHFISGLMESKVDFVAVDNPYADRLHIHILAAVAEHERRMISARTKAALAQVKRELAEKGKRTSIRGRVYTRLGNPPGYDTSRATAKRCAEKPAAYIIDIMRQQRSQGRTYRAIADYLNDEVGSRTPRGHRWHNETIRDLLNRSSDRA